MKASKLLMLLGLYPNSAERLQASQSPQMICSLATLTRLKMTGKILISSPDVVCTQASYPYNKQPFYLEANHILLSKLIKRQSQSSLVTLICMVRMLYAANVVRLSSHLNSRILSKGNTQVRFDAVKKYQLDICLSFLFKD